MKNSQPAELTVQTLCRAMKEARIEGIIPPTAVSKAMAAQKKKVAAEPSQSGGTMPSWVHDLIKKNASPAAIIKAAIKRGLERGDRASLIEVKAVLNEFGRNRDSAAAVVESITVNKLKKIKK